MNLKRIFKRGKEKKAGSESQGSTPRADVPSPAPSVAVFQPFAPLPASTPREPRQIETTTNSVSSWANLTTFSDFLNRTPLFAPLATVINDLSWFVRAHDNTAPIQEEYRALQTQLEDLFRDLFAHFSQDTPPAMSTAVLNLCGAIKTELEYVYGTQDRNVISRHMQADYDLDKIFGCYRRVRGHLERVMVIASSQILEHTLTFAKLNSSLNLWRTVDKQATEAQLRQLNPSMSACYDSAEGIIVQRRECAPNTRKQVLLDLKAWTDDRNGEGVCWMNGMAGTGKTTISYTLCSTLCDGHELGASFFCSRSLPACRDVKLVLPTIAYQLARYSSPFRGALLRFQRMILEPLQEVIGSLPAGVTVVIDALDECDDGNGVEQILEVLLENAMKLPIKFLVSSRPEYHVRGKIDKSALKSQLILHELGEKMVKADIETYLRAELASISITIADGQMEALVEKAGVLFIYAATVVRYIGDGDSPERLNSVLKASSKQASNQTKDIDDLYDAVLASSLENPRLELPEKERMKLLLHTVVCAQEPLTSEALARLLNLSLTQVVSALKPLWSVLHVSGRNPTDRVSILHASFPDYMLDPTRSKQFACNSEAHNGKLAALCFGRIKQNIPQFNICNLESSYQFDQDITDIDKRRKLLIPVDLFYACMYWAVHLDLGGTSDELATELNDFLSKRLLLWMEVLNLTEQMGRGAGLVEKAVSWLQAAAYPDITMQLAQDARRFVTMFATSLVSRSTPHIYVSMLSSWPEHQPIAQIYVKQATDLVQIQRKNVMMRQLGLLSSIPSGNYVASAAYSPDGRFFATGTVDGRIQIWDAGSCRMTIEPIKAHTDWILAITISPDGTRICSGSRDHTLCIWDAQNGQLVAGPLKRHIDWVRSVKFSPDGRWLASGSTDGTVCLWSTEDWEIHGDPLQSHDECVLSIAFSSNSSMLAAGSSSLIHLWNPSSGQMICPPLHGHTDTVNEITFLPGGNYLVSGSDDRTMRVWNVSTGKTEFGPFREQLFEVIRIACSPEGGLLVSASVDNIIRIWNTQTWQVCSIVDSTAVVRSITFAPDGLCLLAACGDKCIRIWDVQDLVNHQVVGNQHDGHGSRVRSVAFSPCGTQFVSGSEDMTVRLWDVQTGIPLHNLSNEHNARVCSVGISANGNHIYAILYNRVICVWETRSGQLVDTIGPIETDGRHFTWYQENWPADFIIEERRVVCGSLSGRIYMWRGGELCFEVTGHKTPVYAIAFAPSGQSFISASGGGEILLWDTSSGEILLGPLKGHSEAVRSISFSSDGSLFASGSSDTTIRLWDSTTGLMVRNPLRGHTSAVSSTIFSGDSRQLVSGSYDMTARIWDVAAGTLRAVYRGHTDTVRAVALSPDQTRIITGSADKTIRLWTISLPDRYVDGAYNRLTI
ncbi:unnamed protein product [Rhizoctonia solani]|uniref:Nephrocystin 3-like N-terminal domain-containing protein n=1 Tax=Rhizoctonia solani TaxID=456999 RepID=A0A8H3DKY4_9AGAM|nr:unnamed protein product [Rhizoctonia solani]